MLTLTDGNIKLLEDENIFDLCQMIMNNLTLVQREKPAEAPAGGRGSGQHTGRRSTPKYEDILIVEHRIFFKDQYRAVYDKKSKNIMAKYDKKRQGLVRDVELATEFDKSVLYEAFEPVYEDYVDVGAERLVIEVVRGKMSGNVKLCALVDSMGMTRELCLFSEQ